MKVALSSAEQQLCESLMLLPAKHKYRYGEAAARELLSDLFWCMAAGREEYLKLLFPSEGGPHRPNGTLKLRDAQGAVVATSITVTLKLN